MGMRYAMLSVRGNGNAPVELRTFRLEHEVYATANQGSFECDDEKLNRIWNMCEQTLQDSVPTPTQTLPHTSRRTGLVIRRSVRLSMRISTVITALSGTIWFSVQRAPTPRRSAMR